MKRLAAIALLGLYLFGTTEACQLLKLPFLISHFVEHNEQNNSSISLIEYLELHYDEQKHSGDEHQNDNKLPFKTVDDCCLTGHTTLPVAGITVQLPVYKLHITSFPEKKAENCINMYTGYVFQPPKTA